MMRFLKRTLPKAVTVPARYLVHLLVNAQYRLSPEAYWRARHLKYGFDPRGAGHCGWSVAENRTVNAKAVATFLDLCRRQRIDLKSTRVLDIGCGTGVYARCLLDSGVVNYTGIDISDVLFDDLRRRFPNCTFVKMDITRQGPEGLYGLVIMVDIEQHIVSPRRFAAAMRQVRRHLAAGGTFVTTSALGAKHRQASHHVVERPYERYKREFPGPDYRVGPPVPFRGHFMFAIRSALR